jgi:hypothetical protein
MKKLLLAAAGLAAALGLAVVPPSGTGRAQPPSGTAEQFMIPMSKSGPPASGFTLPTTPGFDKLPAPRQQGDGPAADGSGQPSRLREYLNEKLDNLEINRDIAVQPGSGPWMICIMWYEGPEAPVQAGKMARYLRSEYRLPAYVFTKGLEERRAEIQRIAEYVQKEQKRLADAHLPPETKIRVPLIRYEIQCAVLVGGYKDMDAANRARAQLKDLRPMDPEKIQLHQEYVVDFDKDNGQSKGLHKVFVNPFTHGMVVRNPSLPSEKATGFSAEDMALLKALNADEPYSLLKCPKPVTLAVKQFSMGVTVQPTKNSSSLLDQLGLTNSAPKEDGAANMARNLAAVLRNSKDKIEAYVLHARHCSYVTVGSYDGPDDPRLKRDQELLPMINRQLPEAAQIVARPVPMAVPR